MISSNDLQNCINMLAQISNGAPHTTRQMAVEIGYILKKELDIVTEIENKSNRRTPDMQGLMNDNVQLFHENQKLLNENMELKNLLEARVTGISAQLHSVCGDVSRINQLITSLR